MGRVSIAPAILIGKRRTGHVGWFDHERRFGFLVRDDTGEQIFVHASHVRRRDRMLEVGDRVIFRDLSGPNRSFARQVRRLERKGTSS